MSRTVKRVSTSTRRGRTSPPVLKIQIDGAARGNPGPAGIGAVLTDESGHKLREISLYLGNATNNVAETCALIIALQEALKMGRVQVSVFTDSELLARQVSGDYRVKDPRLQWLHVLIRQLIEGFNRFSIQHVPRTKNKQADRFANRAVTDGLRRHPRSHPPKQSISPDTSPVTSSQPTFW